MPVRQPAPAARPVAITEQGEAGKPAGKSWFKLPGASDDEMPDIRMKQPYAQDKSMLVMLMLWLFLGGLGVHRFYLGHKILGIAILVIGTAGAFLFFSSAVTIFQTYQVTGKLVFSSMISYALLTIIHFVWVMFDGVYIVIRKLVSG